MFIMEPWKLYENRMFCILIEILIKDNEIENYLTNFGLSDKLNTKISVAAEEFAAS